MPRKPLALDHMVEFLVQEDEYWCRLANDPKSWSAKKRETEQAKARHLKKRRRLSFFRDRTKDHDRDSEPCNVWDLDVEDGEDSDEGILDHVVVGVTPNLNLEERGRRQACKQCGKLKIVNKSCSLRVCKTCCSDSPQECKLTDHKRSKNLGARKPYLQTLSDDSLPVLPGVLDKITRAIQEKSSVYISYEGGTHSLRPRKIQPLQLVRGKTGDQKVTSHCYFANGNRDFYLHKIQRIEDSDWVGESQGIHLHSMWFYFDY